MELIRAVRDSLEHVGDVYAAGRRISSSKAPDVLWDPQCVTKRRKDDEFNNRRTARESSSCVFIAILCLRPNWVKDVPHFSLILQIPLSRLHQQRTPI